jgi:RNA polymerase sigma-70 factor (ECF subfamily)
MTAEHGLRGSGEDRDAVAASLHDPGRFAVVFDRHYEEIWSYLSRRAGGALADELASETFVRAFAGRAGYDLAYPDARPWLYGIATNLLRKHARTEERRCRAYARALERDEFSGDVDAVAGRIDAVAGARVAAAALSRLAPADRDTLLLFALTDLDYEGVARATGVPVGTVRSWRPAPPAGRAVGFGGCRKEPHVIDLELVRELHPPPAARPARGRAHRALLAAIDGAAAPPRRPVRRRLAPLALVGALAAVAVGIVLALSLHGGAANPPSAAAAVLERAARVAEAAGGPRRLRPGEYWYVKSVWTTPGVQLAEPGGRGSDVIVNALSTYERQAWIGLDRPGRVESHVVVRSRSCPRRPGKGGSGPGAHGRCPGITARCRRTRSFDLIGSC